MSLIIYLAIVDNILQTQIGSKLSHHQLQTHALQALIDLVNAHVVKSAAHVFKWCTRFTAVAVLLGVILLGEPLTLGIMLGLPLVLLGSYFASRKVNR